MSHQRVALATDRRPSPRIEGSESEPLEPGEEFGEAHANRLVRLVGRGEEGCGEDITLFMSEAPGLALEDEWTLDSFCQQLASVEQWSEPPQCEMARRWRNWSYGRRRSISGCARLGSHFMRRSGSIRGR